MWLRAAKGRLRSEGGFGVLSAIMRALRMLRRVVVRGVAPRAPLRRATARAPSTRRGIVSAAPPRRVHKVGFQAPGFRVAEFHASAGRRGLEEFFQTGEPTAGDSWTAEILRNKSVDDLHKLWFVLLKERNMLYTMRHAFTARGMIFPNEGRIKKVKRSMKNVKKVCGERERAARDRVLQDIMKEKGLRTRKAAADLLPPRPPKKYPHPFPRLPAAAKYIC